MYAGREYSQKRVEEPFPNLPESGMTPFFGTDLSWILFNARRYRVQEPRTQGSTQSFSLCFFLPGNAPSRHDCCLFVSLTDMGFFD